MSCTSRTVKSHPIFLPKDFSFIKKGALLVERIIRWVLAEERQPTDSGYYTVATATKTQSKKYYWNGSYWVTPGHNPARGVYAWREEVEKNDA